jgi:hypothetical protein
MISSFSSSSASPRSNRRDFESPDALLILGVAASCDDTAAYNRYKYKNRFIFV